MDLKQIPNLQTYSTTLNIQFTPFFGHWGRNLSGKAVERYK